LIVAATPVDRAARGAARPYARGMPAHPLHTPNEGQDGNPIWGEDWSEIRAMWPLEATVAHLNHGSYGAVPTAVLEEQQSWRDRMEANPVRFLARELPTALDQARAEVAQFLGVEGEAIAFVPNATTAVSTVLAGAHLGAGDQVLVTDHTYGAVRIAVQRWVDAAAAELVTVHVPLAAGDDEVCELMTAAVTERTRMAVLDQVTSPTARRLPLVRLVPALQDRGLVVLVDGAHAAGMLDVDLDGIGADFWTGNLHKWCCAPRGTAVLHVAPEHRASVRPLVASWGEPHRFPQSFQDVGTQDLTAWLSAPRALRTLERLDLARVRRHNVELAVAGQLEVARGLGLAGGLPRDPAVSMQLVPLPAGIASTREEAEALQERIATEAAIEVAVTSWAGQGFVRVSAHVYNRPADYALLAAELPALI
jgi:isopenicillin-N epimerase